MSDITQLFRACVKTVKTRNRDLDLLLDEKRDATSSSGDSRRPGKRKLGPKDVVQHITKLRDFLLENRKEYINTGHLVRESYTISDADREKIDTEAQKVMRQCQQVIRDFVREGNGHSLTQQQREHDEAVAELMQNYLKLVCRLYTEQKAIWVKRAVNRQKMSRLEMDKKRTSSREDLVRPHRSSSAVEDDLIAEEATERKQSLENELTLSPEEMQMFEEENQILFEDLNNLVDEVRKIEGKVVEISRLQEVFAEKILEQEKDIEKIADTTVGVTENIKDGNQELREAMKNNAGFRVWVLFFLIVLSFSLLFLDWYNP